MPSVRAVGLVIGGAVTVELVLAFLLPHSPSPSLNGWGAFFVLAIEVLAFLMPPLVLARLGGLDQVQTFRLHVPPWRYALPVLLAAPALSVGLYYLQELWARLWRPWFSLDAATALNEALTVQSGWQVMFLLLLVGIVPAICEEVFFRGFVLSGLSSRLRPSWSIAFTAVLFAAMHVDFLGLPTYLILGLWFGLLAIMSNSLVWPIVAHLLHNGLEVVARNYLSANWLVTHARWLPLASGSVLAVVALLLHRACRRQRG